MKRFSAALLVAVLALQACASNSGKTGATGSDSKANPSGKGTVTIDGGAGAPSSSAKPSTQPKPGGSTSPGAGEEIPLDNVIAAKVNEHASWGCTFRIGTSCQIPWQGEYLLSDQWSGNLVFAAYENFTDKPVDTKKFPIARGHQTFRFKQPYVVGATAKQVWFKAWMEGPKGEVLAETKLQGPFPVTPPA